MKLLPALIALLMLASYGSSATGAEELVSSSADEPGTAWVVAVNIPQMGLIERGEVREVSAYTLGNPAETDDTPCIGASNLDLCEIVKAGGVVYASNEFPLHTRISVDGVEGIVLDRMNPRYRTQVDKAMLDRSEALAFGRKNLEVTIIK